MIVGFNHVPDGVIRARTGTQDNYNPASDLGLSSAPAGLRLDLLVADSDLIGSGAVSTTALVLSGFPADSRLRIVNVSTIQGAGGTGGRGMSDFSSGAYGGGGGGGAGSPGGQGVEGDDSELPAHASWGADGTTTTGGAAGTGGSGSAIANRFAGEDGAAGANAIEISGSFAQLDIHNTGSIYGGGGGGGGGELNRSGGAGGNRGQVGLDGATFGGNINGVGGAPGASVSSSATVTTGLRVYNTGTITPATEFEV